jgi:hypothetical protein
VKIKLLAVFLANMAQQRTRIHTGGAHTLVHIHCNLHNLHPEHHRCQVVMMKELKVPKSMACHLNIVKSIPLFPKLNFSILIHIPRIASTIIISSQIC